MIGRIAKKEKLQRDLRTRYESLSAHERELLFMVVTGLMNKQIAAKMNLSEITIKVHRGQLMRKMKANTLVELVQMEARLPNSSYVGGVELFLDGGIARV